MRCQSRFVDVFHERLWILLLAIGFALPVIGFLCDVFVGINPTMDSETFRYVGWRIYSGARLYMDVWDCKGPVLFLLNAFGWFISCGRAWGCDVVFLGLWIGVLVLMFKILRFSGVGRSGAALGVFLFSVWGCCNGGLQFQVCQEIVAGFGGVLAVYMVLKRKSSFLIGLLVGIASMTKANLVSFGLAAIAVWTYDFTRDRDGISLVRRLVLSALGFVSVLSIFALLYGAANLFDATIAYNVCERTSNVSASWAYWWLSYFRDFPNTDHFYSTLRWNYYLVPLFLSVVAYALFVAVRNFLERPRLAVAMFVWLVFETAMAFISKGFYPHYVRLACLPAMALVAVGCSSRKSLSSVVGGFVVIVLTFAYWWQPVLCGVRVMARAPYYARELANLESVFSHGGGGVATCGASSVVAVLDRFRLVTPQKYFASHHWIHRCSEKRREEILTEFANALAIPGTRYLLSSLVKEDLSMYGENIARLLAGFELVATIREHQLVYVYCRAGLEN